VLVLLIGGWEGEGGGTYDAHEGHACDEEVCGLLVAADLFQGEGPGTVAVSSARGRRGGFCVCVVVCWIKTGCQQVCQMGRVETRGNRDCYRVDLRWLRVAIRRSLCMLFKTPYVKYESKRDTHRLRLIVSSSSVSSRLVLKL